MWQPRILQGLALASGAPMGGRRSLALLGLQMQIRCRACCNRCQPCLPLHNAYLAQVQQQHFAQEGAQVRPKASPPASGNPLPSGTMMCGGLSMPKPATPEVQAIADQVKAQLEAKVNQKYPTFEAVSYCSQVVAGTNFFIKVRLGPCERDFVHLRVFRALPVYGGQVELADFQLGKTREEPILYF